MGGRIRAGMTTVLSVPIVLVCLDMYVSCGLFVAYTAQLLIPVILLRLAGIHRPLQHLQQHRTDPAPLLDRRPLEPHPGRLPQQHAIPDILPLPGALDQLDSDDDGPSVSVNRRGCVVATAP